MEETRWKQVNITYTSQGRAREREAVAHLARVLPTAKAEGLIASWFFVRKGSWRVRYLLASHLDDSDPVQPLLTDGVSWAAEVYEPEVHAFGGSSSMGIAHHLFDNDSHHILAYLNGAPDDRRERSLVLCTELMRSAGLEFNEQGDVWARIAEERRPLLGSPPDKECWARFTSDVRHLLTGQARRDDAGSDWLTTFTEAGASLSALRSEGQLTRGFRAVIALHVIFHWNRMGIPGETQAMMSAAASDAIFG